jgi:hypothetical protein
MNVQGIFKPQLIATDKSVIGKNAMGSVSEQRIRNVPRAVTTPGSLW